MLYNILIFEPSYSLPLDESVDTGVGVVLSVSVPSPNLPEFLPNPNTFPVFNKIIE